MSRIRTYKHRKALTERAKVVFEANHSVQTPPTQLRRSRYGFSPTTSDLTTTEVTLRRASNKRSGRKITLPPMPWDTQP